MYTLDDQQTAAQTWFRQLRDDICAALEKLEDEGAAAPPPPAASNAPPGNAPIPRVNPAAAASCR